MARYVFVAGDSFKDTLDVEDLEELANHEVAYRDADMDGLYDEVAGFDAAVVLGDDEQELVTALQETGAEVMSPHPYDGAVQVPLEGYGLENPYTEAVDASKETGQEGYEERERPIRCLIAKVGLDGHDRGAHVISRAFRDAGFEVVYSGLHNTPEEVTTAAVQEDVDVLGISILSGAHNTLVPKVVDGLDAYDALDDTLLLVGGTIPDDDKEELEELGVEAVFGPGTSLDETVDFILENAPDR